MNDTSPVPESHLGLLSFEKNVLDHQVLSFRDKSEVLGDHLHKSAFTQYSLHFILPIKTKTKRSILTPSCLPSYGTRLECWVERVSASSSFPQSWPCAPCDRVYGKTDQTNPEQRRERGMEDERKSGRMRGWNGCTHKEGKQWENDRRRGGVGMPWRWRRRSGFLFVLFKQTLFHTDPHFRIRGISLQQQTNFFLSSCHYLILFFPLFKFNKK